MLVTLVVMRGFTASYLFLAIVTQRLFEFKTYMYAKILTNYYLLSQQAKPILFFKEDDLILNNSVENYKNQLSVKRMLKYIYYQQEKTWKYLEEKY